MKIVRDEVVVDAGTFSKSKEYAQIHQQILEAIEHIVWPTGSNFFTINPGRHVNGVVPIKEACMEYLESQGWRREVPLDLKATIKRPGNLDAVARVLGSYYAAEWETGNISSSHRAINKIILGLLSGAILGGTLIIGTRKIYPYLTDRIGSIEELEPYFPVWKAIPFNIGVIGIISVEHDKTDINVPPIKKGTDGRALR